MGLLAFTNDKDEIDAATIDTLLDTLDYEITIRKLTDPIDADDHIAQLEQKILRVLDVKKRLSRRDLQRLTNAQRTGLWLCLDRDAAYSLTERDE
jgi:hypothetical protein